MHKRYAFFGLLLALLLGACVPAGDVDDAPAYPAARTSVPTVTPMPPVASTAADAELVDLGPAPAWNNTQWINSEPLPLAELRGKVVLLEFWTFG